ncbi:hypothetical protein PHMEG_00016180 [Phytophthora megakarya]|uniref:Reverse transcriptase n=1 Tax=Phytophthora megakarya TaxID=4795 RepID=A0A225W101_9STRA|nr:hypothetical protein PHMEG_00016180 [Phytophthora megakarya]
MREGYARKLAHLWHGPFRVAEKIGEYAVRINIQHFPGSPCFEDHTGQDIPRSTNRVDFDETLLPEDSWIQDRDPDEYEVEQISDMRAGKRTRYETDLPGIFGTLAWI